MAPDPTPEARLQAGIVILSPVVLLVAFLWHPYIPGPLPNDAAIAAAVVDGPTRWGVAHIAAALASGFVVLAFLGVRSHLREAADDRWSALALPFVVMGSMLYALLPGMEFAPLAAVETGGDAQAAQAALGPWFVPVLVTGALAFALGVLGFAKGVASSRVLGPRLTWLVVGALVAMGITRFVPLAAVQFYVQAAAGLAALWPLGYAMWNPARTRPAGKTRPLPTTTST